MGEGKAKQKKLICMQMSTKLNEQKQNFNEEFLITLKRLQVCMAMRAVLVLWQDQHNYVSQHTARSFFVECCTYIYSLVVALLLLVKSIA